MPLSSLENYYRVTAPPPQLRGVGDRCESFEVAVIGGGFAGLATARGLQERGIKSVAVLEAERVGHGASGRNGGFVFGGYSHDAAGLLRDLGPAPARNLYALTRNAVGLIRRRIIDHGIACERIEGGALLANWFHSARAQQRLRAQARFMREQFGVSWDELAPDEVRVQLHSERYSNALLERDAFHFHPLKYAQGLAALIAGDGGTIAEACALQRIERGPGQGFVLHGSRGQTLRATQLVVAGGGYLHRLLPALERARLPIATYVMVTEPLGAGPCPIQSPAAIYDTRFAFDYYRMLADRRLLWGGRISILEREPQRIAELLHTDMLRVYPQLLGLRVAHAWGGLMSYARHKMPQIGQLAPGLWFAQSFGGHGVAPTTVAGELLADAIAQRRALPLALQRYGLTPVFGKAGLLAAQASYSWAELKDALRDALDPPGRFTR